MTLKHLVVFDNMILNSSTIDMLERIADKITWAPRQYEEEETITQIGDADAVMTCWTNLPEKVLRNTNIKYIGYWGNYYENRIHVPTAKELGIDIDNVPDYAIDAVPELVFAGIHEHARRLSEQARDTLQGNWTFEDIKTEVQRTTPEEIPYWNLRGKTLGIIGLGKIGRRVAEIGAVGYMMDVSYHTRTAIPSHMNTLGSLQGPRWQGAVEMKPRPLNDILKSDIITIHTSPNAEQVLGRNQLEKIRKGALLINTATGRAVDQKAMLELLQQNKFFACLDVYNGAPPIEELRKLPNIIPTYRAGWYTREGVAGKGEQLVQKMQEYVQNRHRKKEKFLGLF